MNFNKILNCLSQLQLILVQTTNVIPSYCGHFNNSLVEDRKIGCAWGNWKFSKVTPRKSSTSAIFINHWV